MTIAGAAILFLLFYSVHGEGVEIVDFKPTLYPSGSTVVSLQDIGELEEDFSNTADVLACMTNKNPCCSTQPNRHGDWTYNNGMVIGTRMSSGINYFRSRNDDQRIYLSRRTAGTFTTPTGQFCCNLPNSDDVMQTRCLEIVSTQLEVNIDTTGTNEVDQAFSLTCTPTVSGGSLSKITWLKDNNEIMSNTTQNTLTHTIGSLSTSDNGEYVCRAEAGTLVKFASFTLEVILVTSVPSTVVSTTLMPTTPPPSVTSVVISPASLSGIAGEPLSLTCTATISGTGTPMFTWSGPSSLSQGPTAGQGSGDTYTDTLTFTRVAQSHEGTYTCQVQLGDLMQTNSVMLSVTVPDISATLRQSRTPTALRTYSLTCEISAPSSLELSSLSYTWRRNSVTVSGQSTSTLDLSPLQFSENGARYTCQYTASSIYLSSNVDIMSGTLTLSITVASLTTAPASIMVTPQTTSVELSWEQSPLDYVNNYTFTYSRTAGCDNAQSGVRSMATSNGLLETYTINSLETAITYRITITAINTANSLSTTMSATTLSSIPSGTVNNLRISEVDFTSITITWDPVPCLQQNGVITNYKIRYFETSATTSNEVLQDTTTSFTESTLFPGTSYTFEIRAVNSEGESPSKQIVSPTTIPTDFGLLKGDLYSNNSIITITDIGQDSDMLFCFMNISNCCRRSDGSVTPRDWYFPNDTVVPNKGSWPISRSRGPRSVILHRNNRDTPTGIYRCQIQNMNVYFGVYSDNAGSPIVTSLTYNTTSGVLNCVSTGGPATTVTWSRSGQQSKRVVNTVMAIYYNTLSINSSNPLDYTGNFTCSVSNRRGGSSATNLYQAVGISGVKELYLIGSSAMVTCFSNFTVQSINWNNTLPSNAMTAMGDLNELILTVTNIQRDLDGTVFTCEATITLPNGGTTTERNSFIFTADEVPPGPVDNLYIQSLSKSSLIILWEVPTMPNGIILAYNVSIFKLDDNMETFNSNVSASEQNVTAHDLEPGVPYIVSVVAINSKGEGNISSNVSFSQELVPLISPKNVKISRTSGTTMTVSWTKLTLIEARGFITSYIITYYPISENRKRQEQNTMNKVVGSDSDSVDIDGLNENSAYSVQISASTSAGAGLAGVPMSVDIVTRSTTGVDEGATEPTTGSNVTVIAVVVAVILAVVIVAVVIIAIIIFMRRRKSSKYSPRESVMISMSSKDTSPVKVNTNNGISSMDMEINDEEDNGEQTYENTVFLVKDRLKPVPLKDFGAHVSRMHADRDKWFEMEYSSIEKSPKFDHDVAAIPENRARNRFGNIFPYDINRVELNIVPNVEHSDYINASYVDGYGRNKVYIAAQGPMENSVEDFWRMIWEQRTPTIVMLTRVFEGKKKCEEYWPENTSDPFIPCSGSSLVIELKSSLPFAEFVMKKMVVSKTDEPKSPSLEVVLFHYLGWPDHGVPANAISMINFIKRVRKSHPYSKEDLMVVHCSAGVGRTGTFITLDYMLERIKNEKTINIYEFVTDLRKQRVLMVQTPAQYIFIHNALDELLTCGDTEVAAANMRIIIGKLSRPAEPGASMSGFQKQFDILGKVTTDVCTLDFSQSVNAANTEKNRYEDRIPFNHTRVRLRPAAAQGSDYINASFVEGYRQKGAYIATQGPLPHTVNDFWRMIWEYECRCIVMLCKSEENGKEACRRYWPQGKGSSEMYGKLMVSLNDQKNMGEYMMRKLEISEHQPRMSVTPTGFSITQFQYLRWQEDIVPNTTATVLEIANLVQKVQMSTGNKPIIVMCNDGVGRSGTFICMHAQMERMKAEAVVDVFQFIKSVRFQRAGLVANKAQYEFCHQVLADFLDGFDTYANFKDII